jgi:MSHA biogenesis protein MshJ
VNKKHLTAIQQINMLSKRDRTILFATTVIAPVLIADSLIFTPTSNDISNYQSEMQQLTENTMTLDAEIAAFEVKSTMDPDKASKQRIQTLTKKINDINKQLETAEINFIRPNEMSRLLEKLLSNNTGITLVSMNNLPVEKLIIPLPEKQKSDFGEEEKIDNTPIELPKIYKHSLVISFKGSYENTLHFIEAVEEFNWQIYWDGVEIKTESYPINNVTITLHTLSLNKGWVGA